VAQPLTRGSDSDGPRADSELGLRLLVLQPTPFCNIDCAYCYLPDRLSTATMSLETVDEACALVFDSGLVRERLEVAWHAGEPLVVPLAWYEGAFALIEQRRPARLKLEHCFQTNGLLLNEAWARFLVRTNAKVGLSIDGPAELHDANRRTRRGGGTHEGAMRAARLLQDEDVPFHVITVLTERALDAPDELFDFYLANGIREVGFNVEEIEGAHGRSSLAGTESEDMFRRFIRRFFARVWSSPGTLTLRELESALGAALLKEPVADEQNVPFAIVSVSVDGKVSTFSPELMGARSRRFGSFAFGRLGSHRLQTRPRGVLSRDPCRNSGGGPGVRARLRLFSLVRRRGAGEQAVRNRPLRRDRDDALPPHAAGDFR
jgi:uncharacterized protein